MMAPQCEHCANIFDSADLDAQQDSLIPCPHCGKPMKVHYTLADSVRDPVTYNRFSLKSLKYVPAGRLIFYILAAIALVIFGVVFSNR